MPGPVVTDGNARPLSATERAQRLRRRRRERCMAEIGYMLLDLGWRLPAYFLDTLAQASLYDLRDRLQEAWAAKLKEEGTKA